MNRKNTHAMFSIGVYMMKNRFVVIDVETTGNHAHTKDRIIQIGAVVIEDEKIIDRFSTFINPEIKLTPFIQQLTGIDDAMVRNAPTFKSVVPRIKSLTEDAYFVAHNVPFDLNFLQAELQRNHFPILKIPQIDTVELSRFLLPMEDGYRLNQLADLLEISDFQPHRADHDAEVTALLLIYLLKKLKQLPLVVLHHLYSLANNLKSDVEKLLTEVISMKEEEANHQYNYGFDIFRGFALAKFNSETMKDTTKVKGFREYLKNYNSIDDWLETYDTFQMRPGQSEMIRNVEHALYHSHHALIEAGSGTGKTIAYLLPAIFLAKERNRPIVISTYTIQLQQQIIERDVPILKKLVPFSFSATIIKGRSHYICLRKFEKFLKEPTKNYDAVLTKAQILVWLTETTTGDIDELNLPSGGKIIWNKINSEVGCCDKNSPWYSRCYYQRTKEKAQTSELIITNHSLLFSDMKSEYTTLPNYSEIIIDEAHHLGNVARNQLGDSLDYFSIHFLLNRLGQIDQDSLLNDLANFGRKEPSANHGQVVRKADQMIKDLKFEFDEFFRMIRSYVLSKNSATLNEIGRITYRYHPKMEISHLWNAIEEAASRIYFQVLDVVKEMEKIDDLTKLYPLTNHESGIFNDFRNIKLTIMSTGMKIKKLFLNSQDDGVFWMEIEPKGALNATYIFFNPVEVKGILHDEFFKTKKGVVLTSATLTAGESFSYVIDQLGISEFQPLTVKIPSAFDYLNRVKIFIPTDLPIVNQTIEQDYVTEISKRVVDIARISQGKMLVLFTSYSMLKQTYSSLKQTSEKDEFSILAQGVNGRSGSKLIKKFKESESGILLGTSGFWEGIDIPGNDLTCVVIVRLPFSNPHNPVYAAHLEKIEKAGGNSFYELSLPEAIIRFKQGFGRLIRTNKDFGGIFIFDQRIITTAYGKQFLNSLPPVKVSIGDTSKLIHELKGWL